MVLWKCEHCNDGKACYFEDAYDKRYETPTNCPLDICGGSNWQPLECNYIPPKTLR